MHRCRAKRRRKTWLDRRDLDQRDLVRLIGGFHEVGGVKLTCDWIDQRDEGGFVFMTIRSPRLLVLDDDSPVLMQVGRLFASHYSVVQLSNPTRAMAFLEADQSVRVFLTEQVMRFG